MVQVSKKRTRNKSTAATLLQHKAFLFAVLFVTATVLAFKIILPTASDDQADSANTSVHGINSVRAKQAADTHSKVLSPSDKSESTITSNTDRDTGAVRAKQAVDTHSKILPSSTDKSESTVNIGEVVWDGTDSAKARRRQVLLQVQDNHTTITAGMRVGGMLSAQSILASGRPYLIYGTAWKKDQTARLVSEAIKAGFRFIDTACQPKHYQEHLVGEGWTEAAAELGLKREDISLQTKFTGLSGQDPEQTPYDRTAPLKEQVEQSLAKSLENLQTDYLDSLVLHSPMSSFDDTMTVWRRFESFVDDGKVRRLGISNCYDYKVFTKLYDQARIKPSVLQNRFYDQSGFDVELRQFCREKDIRYQSFWTLTANRKALASPDIKALASEMKMSPEALMYVFMLSQGHTPLDGTTDPEHMAEDVAVMKRIIDGEDIFKDPLLIVAFADKIGVPREYSAPWDPED